ncbi:AAA family ATPase, partial [Oscillospiraceae bacterium OttesenSCG-928-F05]|nr:AAA family ATPase [Oscillospiraceae bacterium OttesenSCG-928-F05]
MLKYLHIENIAVIEQADIDFSHGFTVLTGETGAGKSMIIDAIHALLGARTSRDLIRTGAERAEVSAVFTELSYGALQWLSENDYEAEEGELLVRRTIGADGKNACKIGGRPATVALLREFGAMMLDIHGQHDSGKLLDDKTHLSVLDRYAGIGDALETYQASYAALRALEKRVETLRQNDADKEEKLDRLRYQIDELEQAALRSGEEEALEARRKILSGAARITEAVGQSFFALYGDEDSSGACDLVSAAAERLADVAEFDGTLGKLSEKS